MFNKLFRGGRGQGRRAGQNQGRGLGGGNKPGSGPAGDCICPNCGYKKSHQVNERCIDIVCPKCGAKMSRE